MGLQIKAMKSPAGFALRMSRMSNARFNRRVAQEIILFNSYRVKNCTLLFHKWPEQFNHGYSASLWLLKR